MSLLDLARADTQTINEIDGDTVGLTMPGTPPVTYESIPCQFIERGASRDAEGFMVVGAETVISISTLALAEAGISDPEALKEKGVIITHGVQPYTVKECLPDYANGNVTAFLKRSA